MNIQLNSNSTKADMLRKKIIENGGYCLCALERTPDTKCLCKAFMKAVEKGYIGECDCGLYEAVQKE